MPLIVRQGAHWLRRHVRRVWQSRGGGFYGFAGTITFLYLEAMSLVSDVTGLRSLDLSVGGIVSFLVQNFVQGIMNVIRASVWPLAWIQHFGVGFTSGALLVGCYFTFRLTQPAVLRLLQEPGEVGGMLSEGSPFAAGDPTASTRPRAADHQPLGR